MVARCRVVAVSNGPALSIVLRFLALNARSARWRGHGVGVNDNCLLA